MQRNRFVAQTERDKFRPISATDINKFLSILMTTYSSFRYTRAEKRHAQCRKNFVCDRLCMPFRRASASARPAAAAGSGTAPPRGDAGASPQARLEHRHQPLERRGEARGRRCFRVAGGRRRRFCCARGRRRRSRRKAHFGKPRCGKGQRKYSSVAHFASQSMAGKETQQKVLAAESITQRTERSYFLL